MCFGGYGTLPVRGATVCGSEEEDEPLLFVDLIEEAPGADAVAPGRRFIAFEPSNVRAHVRMLTQLGVHDPSQLVDDFSMAGAGDAV